MYPPLLHGPFNEDLHAKLRFPRNLIENYRKSEKKQKDPQGSKQRIVVREGFWQILWIFGRYFWKSFPYKIPGKYQEKAQKIQEKPRKN